MILNKRLLKQYSTPLLKVYVVNGGAVRKNHIEFVLGGHSLVYPEYIPTGEIWLDDAQSKSEMKYTLYHELVEIQKMNQGYSYEDAHYNFANPAESKARNGKIDIDDLLKGEIDKIRNLIIESSHYNGQVHNGIHDKNNVHHSHKSRIRQIKSYESNGISMTR